MVAWPLSDLMQAKIRKLWVNSAWKFHLALWCQSLTISRAFWSHYLSCLSHQLCLAASWHHSSSCLYVCVQAFLTCSMDYWKCVWLPSSLSDPCQKNSRSLNLKYSMNNERSAFEKIAHTTSCSSFRGRFWAVCIMERPARVVYGSQTLCPRICVFLEARYLASL